MTSPAGVDEVVRELNKITWGFGDTASHKPKTLAIKAADLLTALSARVAALTAEMDKFNADQVAWEHSAGAQIAAAEAEAQTLRVQVAKLEVQLGDTDEALKDTWAKHGGTEIALGQWKYRAEAAEAEDQALRAEAQKLRAEITKFRTEIDSESERSNKVAGKLWDCQVERDRLRAERDEVVTRCEATFYTLSEIGQSDTVEGANARLVAVMHVARGDLTFLAKYGGTND